jgi:polyhydroxyalkanoate synthesis regulator phasin
MLNDQDIQKLSSILATKSDVNMLRSDIDALKSEVKSFKLETRESFTELNGKMDDLTEVVMNNHDKRIEILEEKVLSV